MSTNAQEIYNQVVRTLSPNEQLRLANLILNKLVEQKESVIDKSDTWTKQDCIDITNFSMQYSANLLLEDEEMF
jgi:hypothetical protein